MRSRIFALVLIGLAAGVVLVQPADSPARFDDADNGAPPGVEVQARGPVHEAFGEASATQSGPGPIVMRDPPRAIEELPPEEKPEGDNVVWIPGYWAWDEEASNYVWISGFWRAVPPDRTWIPGSWQKAGAGYRWVAGYWGAAGQDELQYLPPPPEPIDNGPSIPAPGENYSYVPGNWVFQTTRYVWSPGYWVAYRPGWVWTSPCYRWTPCGYVYVAGYWDYPLLDRGLLFAPVCFPTGVYLTPGFVYRPTYCIQPDFLCGALFVRRGFGCYYFGDYFGSGYRSSFVAWNRFRFGRGVGFDLNFCYYRNAFRGYPGWERGLNGLYAGRYGGMIARPPRTLVQQRNVINNIVVNKTVNNVVNNNVRITNLQNVNALTSVRNAKRLNVTAMSSLAGLPPKARNPAVNREIRVARLNASQLAQEKQGITRFNTIAQQRRMTEGKLAAKAPKGPTAAPIRTRLDLPKGTPPARIVKTPTPPPIRGGRPNGKVGVPPRPGTRPGTGAANNGPRPGTRPTTPGATVLPGTRPGDPKGGTRPLPKGGTTTPPRPKTGTPPPRPKAGAPTRPGTTVPPRPGAGTPPPRPNPTRPGTTPPPRPGTTVPPPRPGTTVPPPRPGSATPPPRPRPNPNPNRPGNAGPGRPGAGNPGRLPPAGSAVPRPRPRPNGAAVPQPRPRPNAYVAPQPTPRPGGSTVPQPRPRPNVGFTPGARPMPTRPLVAPTPRPMPRPAIPRPTPPAPRPSVGVPRMGRPAIAPRPAPRPNRPGQARRNRD